MDLSAIDRFDPAFLPSAHEMQSLAHFIAVVRQLRRDCPWDREQTHESVRHLLIEEAYETVEAIDAGDWQDLRKELGDVLLHVVFHGVMAEEEERFTLRQVVDGETEKLVRRHPHVFGDTTVNGVDDVLSNWETIKLTEGDRRSALSGVPSTLPSLLRALRMQEKAAGVGFDFRSAEEAWTKVEEETAELRTALDENESTSRAEAELGDLLFSLVNFARLRGLNPENALRQTADRFSRRFQFIEDELRKESRSVKEASLESMDALWNKAKRAEVDQSPPSES